MITPAVQTEPPFGGFRSFVLAWLVECPESPELMKSQLRTSQL